jgi:uncharacterized protein DUF4150
MSVFANGNEISGKATPNKSMAATPDVCLSPPSPPAGPVPIPYPNTAMASDTTDGSKSVKIKGKEAGLKNQSSYKKSMGDEAATKTLGMGVISHNIQGKMKFAAWSFDVQFEGLNVCRHMDLTTHNHMNTGQVPTVNGASMAPAATEEGCKELDDQNKATREKMEEKTKDKSLMGATGQQEGTTVSSSSFPAGQQGGSVMTAHSSGKALEKLKGQLAPGGDMEDRATGESNLCNGFKHAPPYKQKSGHTEARLMDDTFAANPGGQLSGQMVINIDWRPKSKPGTSSKMPCEDCHKVLCAAKKCEIQIFLCDKNNKPQELTEEHCPPEPATYQNLQETMGEIPEV